MLPDQPEPSAPSAEQDRLHFVRLANRLANAFWVWAIVVGAVGGFLMIQMGQVHSQQAQVTQSHSDLVTKVAQIEARQQDVLRRLAELEADEKTRERTR